MNQISVCCTVAFSSRSEQGFHEEDTESKVTLSGGKGRFKADHLLTAQPIGPE
jgi:hypothetical protein